MKGIVPKLQAFFNTIGLDIRAYPTKLLRNRIKLINGRNINLLLDVGANIGQYSLLMRQIGYFGKIVSFEPLSEIFKKLEKQSVKDANWEVNNYALGNQNEIQEINISGHHQSSSLMGLHQNHIDALPDVEYIGTEKITVKTLDSIFLEEWKDQNIFLKLDVQGFEKQVLEGALNSLSFISGIQIELSLAPLYNTEISFLEMIQLLKDLGFSLYSIEPGFTNKETGQMLQVDGLFFRNKK